MIDSYTSFINNWKQAKEAIKSTCNSKPAFARYLEVCKKNCKLSLSTKKKKVVFENQILKILI